MGMTAGIGVYICQGGYGDGGQQDRGQQQGKYLLHGISPLVFVSLYFV
jgi:hypothetical protein